MWSASPCARSSRPIVGGSAGGTWRVIGDMMPFGVMKRSGFGLESGLEATRESLETANPFVMR